MKKLITIKEAADQLGVSYQSAARLFREGPLTPAVVRLGRIVRIHPEKLQDLIQSGGAALPGGWRREPQTEIKI